MVQSGMSRPAASLMASVLPTSASRMHVTLPSCGLSSRPTSPVTFLPLRDVFSSPGMAKHAIGASSGHYVARHTKGRKDQNIIKAPKVQKWYAKFFNAVDRNDRDSSDYTTPQRTNSWYLHIKFWILDRDCHQVFQSAIWCYEKLKIGSEEWCKYLKKNGIDTCFKSILVL